MLHLVGFSVRQGLEGVWRNRVMSLAATVTMVMMLVLLASLVIVLSGIQAGVTFIESKVEIRASSRRAWSRSASTRSLRSSRRSPRSPA